MRGKNPHFALFFYQTSAESALKQLKVYLTIKAQQDKVRIDKVFLVRDVMSSPVITSTEDTTINSVAKLFEEYDIGCVIVECQEQKAVGIVTARDLVRRVLAKNMMPRKVTARDIMTSPLITVDPYLSIPEAARIMSDLDVRRLGVMYRGNLVGIISSTDILAVTPELIETIQERAKIAEISATEEANEYPPMAGYCDHCGLWSDTLEEIEGNFVCEDCEPQVRMKLS